MNNKQTTACFSGHRYYPGAETDETRLAEAVEAAYRDGYRTFISGMATGFDLAAAEAVVRLKDLYADIRLIAAIPFKGQAAKYPLADRARYDTLLAAADEIWTLSERYSYGCYYRRDERMVERSARLICWYDGKKGSSGTRYTVRKALASLPPLEIVNLFRDPGGTLF